METKNTKSSVLLLLALFAMLLVTAQEKLDFNKYVLVSGNDRQQGAMYRFSSVKNGVDAIVTIHKLTKSASLDSLDFSMLDFTAALQPELSVAPHCWGYIEFNIQFVKEGTSTPVVLTGIPLKDKSYRCCGDNHKDVKLYILKNSATSFKVIMYMANFYSHTLTRKADVFMQKTTDANMIPTETAAINFTNNSKSNYGILK